MLIHVATRHTLVLGLMLAIGATGCGGGGDPNRPRTYKTTGSVTLDGKPVSGATVTFAPLEGGPPSVGMSNDAGVFEMTTFSRGDGAVAGSHAVRVEKFELPKSAATAAASTSEDDYVPPSGPLPEPKNVLPKKYAVPTTSGLSATVNTSNDNVVNFELSSK